MLWIITSPNQYCYVGKFVDLRKYMYELKQMVYRDTFEYAMKIEPEVTMLNKITLEQNYTNQFNSTTVIDYSIPE